MEYVKTIEQFITYNSINDGLADNIRSTLIDVIILNKGKTKYTQMSDMTKLHKLELTKKFLKNNRDIIFIYVDKRNVTVAMNKWVHKAKMNALFSDRSKYSTVKKSPLKNCRKKLMMYQKVGIKTDILNAYIKIMNSHRQTLLCQEPMVFLKYKNRTIDVNR